MVSTLKRLSTEWEKNLSLLYILQGVDKQNIQEAQKTKVPEKSMTQ
jgi:hypothetical protein